MDTCPDPTKLLHCKLNTTAADPSSTWSIFITLNIQLFTFPPGSNPSKFSCRSLCTIVYFYFIARFCCSFLDLQKNDWLVDRIALVANSSHFYMAPIQAGSFILYPELILTSYSFYFLLEVQSSFFSSNSLFFFSFWSDASCVRSRSFAFCSAIFCSLRSCFAINSALFCSATSCFAFA